jgi:hypothetical protein
MLETQRPGWGEANAELVQTFMVVIDIKKDITGLAQWV